MDTARLQVMDEGHGGNGTAQVIQDRYGVMLGQQWLNSQETVFVTQSGRADFCGSEDKEISSIKDVDKRGLTTSVIFCNSLRIGIIKLSSKGCVFNLRPATVLYLKDFKTQDVH